MGTPPGPLRNWHPHPFPLPGGAPVRDRTCDTRFEKLIAQSPRPPLPSSLAGLETAARRKRSMAGLETAMHPTAPTEGLNPLA